MKKTLANWVMTNYLAIFLTVLILKLLILPWAAHPFDFWSIVNTFQRSTIYDWNVFEFWSKGNLLIAIWYPFYSLYLKINQITAGGTDNLLLLHLVFKIPFLFVDCWISYFIYSIVKKVRAQRDIAILAALGWFVNPIAFYVYGIHGHYEILVALALTLLLYGLIYENAIALSTAFIIGITTKYFILLFIPFFLIYLIYNKKYRLIIITSFFTIIGLTASYIQLFFYTDQIKQLVRSIGFLSSANVPEGITVLSIPPLNIFAAANFLLRPHDPITTITLPNLFMIANSGLKIIALLMLVHIIQRLFYIHFRHKYTKTQLVKDIYILLIYLLIFITNFQPHYIIWLLPLIFYFIFAEKREFMTIHLIAITVIGFIFELKNELGPRTFFLDIFSVFYFPSLNEASQHTLYKIGAMIVFAIVLSGLSILFEKRQGILKKTDITYYFVNMVLLWAILLIPFYYIPYYFKQPKQHTLAYARDNNLNPGAIFESYEVYSNSKNVGYFSDSKNNSLVTSEIQKLPKESKSLFKLAVLYKGQESNIGQKIDDYADKIYFNDCRPVGFAPYVFDLYTKKYYPGLVYDINCLRKSDNKVEVYEKSALDVKSLSLYVFNTQTDKIFSPNKRVLINILSILALAMISGGACTLIWVLKKIRNDK